MFCQNCGNKIESEDYIFCDQCGTKIREEKFSEDSNSEINEKSEVIEKPENIEKKEETYIPENKNWLDKYIQKG